LNSLKQTVEHY